jgi:anti-sigma factor RsiW
VKPWFAGELDYSPVGKNPDAQGFPLVGGRIEYVGKNRLQYLFISAESI